MWYNKKQCYVNKKGAAMNQYIGQQFAALRYEKNILVSWRNYICRWMRLLQRGFFMSCVSLSLWQCGVGLFYCQKGIWDYESEIYRPQLWNTIGLWGIVLEMQVRTRETSFAGLDSGRTCLTEIKSWIKSRTKCKYPNTCHM